MTAVHKANIMKKADGIFLESCQEVAKLYPQVRMSYACVCAGWVWLWLKRIEGWRRCTRSGRQVVL